MKDLYCCGECGRSVEKIHRRYRGVGYCNTCYARVFKLAECPKCGQSARLPSNVPGAVCRYCLVDKPCVRCGEQGRSIGVISEYGVVCASCAPYFKEYGRCEVCDGQSQRLSRISRFRDGLKRCERCASADLGTCINCRRYRKVFKKNGNKICKLCLEGKTASCVGCGNTMPQARGKQCEDCYWSRLYEKRILIYRELLESAVYQLLFESFASWLLNDKGAHRSALMLARYSAFFRELEIRWPDIPEYKNLLESFGVDYVRRHRKVIDWLAIDGGLDVDVNAKATIAEEHRIKRVLSRAPLDTVGYQVSQKYYAHLNLRYRKGGITLLTVRLLLSPAMALLTISEFNFPDASHLSSYLHKAPGQRNSIGCFIRFINDQYDAYLRMPKKPDANLYKKTKLERKLVSLAESGNLIDDLFEWIALSLDFFHDVKVSKAKLNAEKSLVCYENEGYIVGFRGEKYFIPKPGAW